MSLFDLPVRPGADLLATFGLEPVNPTVTVVSPTEVVVGTVCCGIDVTLPARLADLKAWEAGALIQVALPYLDADQREVLVSGICAACF